MTAAAYRRLATFVGGLVLVSCALTFADIGNWISVPLARIILWPQFMPSLLGMVTGLGWISAGCVAVVAVTLLFGRVYCAMLCPLGVLMDLSAWLARRTGKKRRLPFREGLPWLRAAVVLLCTAGLLAGISLPLAFLDPYSIFGKISAATLRPMLAWANHTLASTGAIQPVSVSPVAMVTTSVAAVLLALVVITAILRGRLWCNTVCPVGALLGFFSRKSWFRLQIANDACVGCSMCERVCPAQCIDFRNHRIDHSRCVMCLDCVTSCKRSGISLTRSRCKTRQPTAATPDSADSPGAPAASRRRFLTSAIGIPALTLAEGKLGKNTDRKTHAVLPPGAKSLAHFQSRCTACHLCVANCPDQVLRPSITQHGLAGFLQPFQDFTVSFCSYNCSNCSQICPTGAIMPLTIPERRLVRTGLARFDQDLCIVKTKGTPCGACSEHCPTQSCHMVPWKDNLTIPEVDPDLCIGCGGCEFICPVRPNRAIQVSGLAVHERAKELILGRENTVRETEEEFPF